MIVYDQGGIKVRVCPGDFLNISVWGRHVFVTPEELADMADAVAQHLEIESAAEYIEPFFTEEDLAAGRRAIAELEVEHV